MAKRIVILGGGESGAGAAILARKHGFDVFVSDMGQVQDVYTDLLDILKIPYEQGGHTPELILNADEVIKSPGIPSKAAIVQAVMARGIPIISEIEFAYRFTDAKMICVTGSNGKSTTSSLIYHILSNAGLNVGLAGNIGKSLAFQVAQDQHDHYVVELSSFMLDDMHDFKADIAVLLNITPDHLDRYDYDFEKYAAAKFRIVNNQGKDDHFVYCQDDEVIQKLIAGYRGQAVKLPFTIKGTVSAGSYLDKGEIVTIVKEQEEFRMPLEELALGGQHNTYNSMAASTVAKVLEIRNKKLRESLADYKNIPHRLEDAGEVNGVKFINDSKATNVNSTWYALDSVRGNVVLILGGVDKGNDYQMLQPLVRSKVKGIVCLGKDNNRLYQAFEHCTPLMVNAQTAQEAVELAYNMAGRGDTVLLSPACASFDLFKNFEDRGDQFKKAVAALQG